MREFLELIVDTAVEKGTITQGQRDAIMRQHDQSQRLNMP
jgi:hypothetical protein